MQQQQQQNPNGAGEEKKDDDGLMSTLGMAEEELSTTLSMCGLPVGASTDLLLAWMHQCAAKGTSDAYKKIIICKHIMLLFRYEDTKVPLTNAILKMAVKKNWLVDEANITCPSLGNAGAGLSLFIILDIDQDEEDDALVAASLVKLSEILV